MNDLEITKEDFKLIKSFYPELTRKAGIHTNDFIIGWSELMPVVEKIENECKAHVTMFNKCSWIEFYGVHNDPCKFERTTNSFILNVYNTVVEFIKWYNSEKQNVTVKA